MAEITINKEWIREAVQPVIDNVKANYFPKSVLDDIRAEISHKIKLCSDKKMSYGMEVALAIIDKLIEGSERE